jgi:ABC-2 type transport system permease protein
VSAGAGSVRISNAWDVVVAFFRLDAVDELSYPLSMVFRFLSPLVSVAVYFFQAQFLGRPDSYAATLVGVSVALALQLGLTGVGNRLQTVQDRGTFEPILVEPVPWWVVPVTMNIWQSLAGAVTMVLMLATGVALGAEITAGGLPAFAVVFVLGMLACNAIGILSASLIVLAKRSSAILGLYGLAASLLGGALFSIEVLPGWLRPFSYLVPHTYVISASRDLLVPGGVGSGMSMWHAVVGLLAFNALAFPLGLYAFTRALGYSRRMGLLGGY